MLYDIYTVFWRDFIVLKRHISKFILARMVAPLLYLVAFGWGLGRSVNLGGNYIDFLVPGLLAMNSMNISFTGIIAVHAERVYHRSLEEYLLSPIKPAAYLWGKLLSALLRSLISGGIILALSFAFGAKMTLALPMLLVLALNSAIFAEVGFYAAMKLSTYEEMSRVNTYLLLPMTFLCGTFFRVDTLPETVGCVINLLPLTHACSLFRSLAMGGGLEILPLLVLVLYAVLGFVLSLRAFSSSAEG